MKLSRAVLMLVGTSLVGCGAGVDGGLHEDLTTTNDGFSYEQFLSMVYQEPDTGLFVANGDETFQNEDELRAYYKAYIQDGQRLAIMRNSFGADVRWTDAQKTNITYCVSTKFGTRYNAVVAAMNTATAAWEGAANVNFVHVSAQDGSCTNRNNNVLFDVNPVNVRGQYLARAFFPSYARKDRNVLIDNSSFTLTGDPTLAGILRHELGHTLGFRHEHTRPESGTCFEDNNWRALTPYDSDSVMHYPQCNGTGDWSLVLTNDDKAGAASVYGP